jgi:hypothetical protein
MLAGGGSRRYYAKKAKEEGNLVRGVDGTKPCFREACIRRRKEAFDGAKELEDSTGFTNHTCHNL